MNIQFITLYEDVDINNNHERGKFSIVHFSYNQIDHSLIIGKRIEEFNGMLNTRTFEIIWVGKNKPSAMQFESKPDETIKYIWKEVNVKWK